ncbi:HIT domain protein [uncultured archaeon]|nr:HIT domain protein [uncultured archaeon]
MSKIGNQTDCIFCKIIKGEIPAVKLWEDEKYFVFLDKSPINPGHTLVLPKKHTDYIFDLNDKEYTELMLKAKEIAKILKKKLNPKRVGMAVEGFFVPHVHIHLVPENRGNELNPERAMNMDVKELNKLAEKITK